MSWICFMRFIQLWIISITLVCSLERWIVNRHNALYFSWTEMRSTYRVEIKGDYRFNLLQQGIRGCFIPTNGFAYDMQKKHLRQTCPNKPIQTQHTIWFTVIKTHESNHQSTTLLFPSQTAILFVIWTSHIQWPI